MYSVALSALVCGCADLGAVQEFGQLSANSAGYTKLTSEYVASPNVQRNLLLLSDSVDEKTRLELIGKRRLEQERPLLAYHEVVGSYMTALADLAGDQVPSFDRELDGLVEVAARSELVSKPQANALKSLSGLIAYAATSRYRQRKLREIIEDANAPLQSVLSTMGTIVASYKASIEDEKSKFDSRYAYLINEAHDTESVAEQLTLDAYVEKEGTYGMRLKAVEEYRRLIETIAAGHQSLFENRENLGSQSAISAVRVYSIRIYKVYKTTRELEGQ